MTAPIPDLPPNLLGSERPAPSATPLAIGRPLSVLLTILAGTAVAYLAWQALSHFSHLLLMLTLAVLIAFVFAPLVERLQRRGLPRGLAILVAYLGSLLLVGVALFFLLGPLVSQLGGLASQVPDQLQSVRENGGAVDEFFIQRRLPMRMADIEQQVLSKAEGIGDVVLGGTLGILTGLAGVLVDGVVVLVLSFYFLLDSTSIHNNFVRLLPERWRKQAFLVEAAFVKVVGGYIRGQLFMGLTIGVAAAVGCWLLGVPYPLVVGLLAGVFELVPMLGPILAAVPAVLISLTQPFPLVLWVILFFLIIQQVESNVIGPKITGHAVGLHPLGALIALLAGIELGGLVGALFAVPVAGILYVLAVAVYWEQQGKSIPTSLNRPSLVGLARGLVPWRSPVPPPSSAVIVPDAVARTAATIATAGGDTVPRPETLVSLEHQARQLQDRFEEAEAVRQVEQAQAVAQAQPTDATPTENAQATPAAPSSATMPPPRG